ncbi:hypothetical protein L208DRAFT_1379933 [Tricholoma matsutake]|nr:hypothetical protein L208DRAFT_1379933 [Tricholoma matsutake 945]
MAIIIEVTYGHQIKKDNDPYLTIANKVCHIVTPAVSPSENSLVNLFPFLQYFPSWFPGTHHATVAKAARPIVQRLYEYPFFDIKKKLIYKALQQSSTLLAQKQQVTLEMTSSTLQIFLLALFEFQKRAQEEINLVVGDEHLPELSDHPSLPFLESLIQESQRWCPTIPLEEWHWIKMSMLILLHSTLPASYLSPLVEENRTLHQILVLVAVTTLKKEFVQVVILQKKVFG